LINSIIPNKPILVNISGKEHTLNREAIAAFSALGFFLDRDTYWNDETVIMPATNYTINDASELTSEKEYFEWHYSPRDISFETALEEFTEIFESSLSNYNDKTIILPLSGGLDSRTIAVALQNNKKVNAYSYHFEGGINESSYGKKIADTAGFNFKEFVIPSGYLWKGIERLAAINQCYAEFTHPRQMFIIDKLQSMGDIIMAGHGGDLFFDGMGVSDNLSLDEQINHLVKKLIRKGGKELADSLWNHWGLQGTFTNYIYNRFETLLKTLPIDNANARLRAFKSKYYVHRWSMVNMEIFLNQRPVFAPYFTDEMCQFICTLPEELLKGRKLQIEYIKRKSPSLAFISWQSKAPYNLFNSHRHTTLHHLPYRINSKLKNTWREHIAKKPLIQRNWELQFLGKDNDEKLRHWLYESPELNKEIPREIVEKYYHQFKSEDAVYWSHPISMLLTLSVKLKNNL
jgi:asparagine synthetase B (glutamine-hydrolysing)